MRSYRWENTNKLLGTSYFNGVKTGITDAAGPCLAASYDNGDVNIIIIVLNSKTMEQRWIEVPKIAEWMVKRQQNLK